MNTGSNKVPPGTYPVQATTLVPWAGRPERWFKITANGRTGWIEDDEILIDSKSASCP